ncbi:MAG: DUF456 domain-containing protein [Deltaproteobacteria bacterium]|nr:DUF456 domain-containing protein [Deltaproteobacteria bacterium]MBW2446406.1 DUF456 domain-containing protein [Deltaproteobacteria bacterium]
MDANTVAALILAILLVGTGLAGVLFPALPGTAFVFAGLALAAWTDGFVRVGTGTVALLGGLTVLTYVIEFGASLLGAKKFGASRQAVLGAALGTVVGIFFGLPGILFGPFLGAVLGEYAYRQNLEQAGRVGLGTWIGFALGLAAKLAITFTMLGIFVGAWFFWE